MKLLIQVHFERTGKVGVQREQDSKDKFRTRLVTAMLMTVVTYLLWPLAMVLVLPLFILYVVLYAVRPAIRWGLMRCAWKATSVRRRNELCLAPCRPRYQLVERTG